MQYFALFLQTRISKCHRMWQKYLLRRFFVCKIHGACYNHTFSHNQCCLLSLILVTKLHAWSHSWKWRETGVQKSREERVVIPCLHDQANIEQTSSKCIQNKSVNCLSSAWSLLAFIQLVRQAMVISMLIRRAGGL